MTEYEQFLELARWIRVSTGFDEVSESGRRFVDDVSIGNRPITPKMRRWLWAIAYEAGLEPDCDDLPLVVAAYDRGFDVPGGRRGVLGG